MKDSIFKEIGFFSYSETGFAKYFSKTLRYASFNVNCLPSSFWFGNYSLRTGKLILSTTLAIPSMNSTITIFICTCFSISSTYVCIDIVYSTPISL